MRSARFDSTLIAPTLVGVPPALPPGERLTRGRRRDDSESDDGHRGPETPLSKESLHHRSSFGDASSRASGSPDGAARNALPHYSTSATVSDYLILINKPDTARDANVNAVSGSLPLSPWTL